MGEDFFPAAVEPMPKMLIPGTAAQHFEMAHPVGVMGRGYGMETGKGGGGGGKTYLSCSSKVDAKVLTTPNPLLPLPPPTSPHPPPIPTPGYHG